MKRIRMPKGWGGTERDQKQLLGGDFFHLHSHSHYSCDDALPPVSSMVTKVSSMGHKALALTDHGNMAGAVQLYQECSKEGIAPFPGLEAYVVQDRSNKKEMKRRHLGLVAFSTDGYEKLCRISSYSHKRENFHHKPLLDYADLAEFADRGWTDGIALTTGCYFGVVIQSWEKGGMSSLRASLEMLAKWFPHTYVELQNHHIDHEGLYTDEAICDALYARAQEMGLPVVITNDAHYTELEHQPIHDDLKRMVAYGPDPDDAVFPGDGFHLCDEQWMSDHFISEHYDAGIDGLDDLYSKHTLAIEQLDNYHYNVPFTVERPDVELDFQVDERLVEEGLGPEYEARADEEMEVIEASGMASYLLLVKEVADWCADHGVFTQARGSASGSLVTSLLGITQVDPLEYSLRFERFLSKDRTKPPDIDLDVEDVRRDELLDWLRQRFAVHQIGTWSTYSVDTKEGRGSLLVSYISRARKEGKDVSHIKGLHDLPKADRDSLVALSDMETKKSAGTHAAGVVVTSSDDEFQRLVPTMLIPSSNTTVSQYEMDDIEALGLVKLDVLGLRTLTLLRRCVEMLGRDVKDGLDFIPLDDGPTYTQIRQGRTEGVFQLEGWTAQRGCQEMKVRDLDDIIAIMALYRPATMNTGVTQSFINRRAGWESVPKRHPDIEKHLKETNGLPIFQEQVISILRGLGFDPEDLTKFLKAVKASNKNVAEAERVIEKYRELFEKLSLDAAWSDQDRTFMWDAIEGFSEYGFNKAHATAYGLTAYRMAYLKKHHPLEFSAALLETSAGTQKEKQYVKVVRDMGIKLLRPDVNVSGANWTLDRDLDAIRRGLMSIKGVGVKAATELATYAPYDTVEGLIEKTDNRAVTGGKSWRKDKTLNGTMGILREAGALQSLGLEPS